MNGKAMRKLSCMDWSWFKKSTTRMFISSTLSVEISFELSDVEYADNEVNDPLLHQAMCNRQ